MVSSPFWLVLQAGGGMEMDHLVVLHSQVLPVLLQVGHLHEVPSGERFTDVGVVVLGVEIRADLLDAQALHNPHLSKHLCHRKASRVRSLQRRPAVVDASKEEGS